MASQPGVFNVQQFTDAGLPAASYRLYTLVRGTTTHKAAFTDAAGLVPHTYTSDGAGGLYILLNARGELPAPLFLASGAYDLTLKTPAGATVWTRYAAGASEAAITLAADLADSASVGKGLALSGLGAALAYAAGTGAHAAQRALSVSMFSGADPTGATACDAAINIALSTAKTLNLPLLVDGRFRHSAQLVIPSRVRVHGTGWTSDSATASRSGSAFIKDFNGVGVLLSGDDATIDGVQIDSITGRTGDALQVTGSRVKLLNGASTNAGGDAVRVGKTEAGASSINANCGVLMNWQMLNCGGWGLQFDHTNTSTSGTFPLGAPDCNAWTVSHVVIGASGQPCVLGGIKFGNTIDNVVTHAVIQDNTGRAIQFATSARGNVVTAYCEGNAAGGPLFDSGAKYNILRLTSTLITSNEATDSDGTNLIERAIAVTGGWAASKLQMANLTAGGVAELIAYVEAGANDAGAIRFDQPTGTRGRATLQTRTNGGARADRLVLDGELRAAFNNLSEGVLFNKAAADTTTPGVNILGAGGRIDVVNSGTSSTVTHSFYNGNGQVGTISTNGTATTYATSSDYRLKRDAVLVDGVLALAAVMSWPIKSFVWRADDSRDVGVIAHELQAVKPGAVTGTKDGADMQGVDYSKLVPELVAAVQHLAGRVVALEDAA